ncbi:DsbA family protein [Chryseomicrobium sp. FSL W7-1435]|uniref:DsbA family protein n=1 Tax=Chryseomicrobium sp. FSL W7-1435 TaxID=2921704 RepID=UPI00315AA368
MKTNQKIMLVTLALAVVIVGIVLYMNRDTGTTATEVPQETERAYPPTEGQPMLGNPDAPVEIVEFGDYKCPSCKQWGETVYPKIVEDFIDTEKANLSYINVLFHGEESVIASLASESVFEQDPENFWDFNKAVYDAQPTSQQHDEPWVTIDKMAEIAQATAPGVDVEKMRADMASEDSPIVQAVTLDNELVEEFGIPFTPTIYINGVFLEDPFDYEMITMLIEQGQSSND